MMCENQYSNLPHASTYGYYNTNDTITSETKKLLEIPNCILDNNFRLDMNGISFFNEEQQKIQNQQQQQRQQQQQQQQQQQRQQQQQQQQQHYDNHPSPHPSPQPTQLQPQPTSPHNIFQTQLPSQPTSSHILTPITEPSQQPIQQYQQLQQIQQLQQLQLLQEFYQYPNSSSDKSNPKPDPALTLADQKTLSPVFEASIDIMTSNKNEPKRFETKASIKKEMAKHESKYTLKKSEKDEYVSYLEKRKKNNESSKKCRQNARLRAAKTEILNETLTQENEQLK
eukprot:Pgem_evm1s19361